MYVKHMSRLKGRGAHASIGHVNRMTLWVHTPEEYKSIAVHEWHDPHEHKSNWNAWRITESPPNGHELADMDPTWSKEVRHWNDFKCTYSLSFKHSDHVKLDGNWLLGIHQLHMSVHVFWGNVFNYPFDVGIWVLLGNWPNTLNWFLDVCGGENTDIGIVAPI